MNNKECVLLLTGTINTNPKVPFLSVDDSKERKNQYLNALKFYISKSNVKKIVFCENSCEKMPDSLEMLAKENNVDFEWLSFNGNVENTIIYGKSFGESEIIDYALDNSRLLKNTNYFIKITGRLIVKNINTLTFLINKRNNYFDAYGNNRMELIDSRLFAVRKSDFCNLLQKAYFIGLNEQCNSIEQLYPIIIRDSKIKIASFPIKLWFDGISGGYGMPYKSSLKEIIITSLKYYYLSHGGKRLFFNNIQSWQGDMKITEDVWNKYFGKFSSTKLALCGIGKIGRRIYTVAEYKCKKVLLADANYKHIKKVYGTRVVSYEKITHKNKDIDYYLICVKKRNNYEEIKNELIDILKSDKKICWIMDYINEEESAAKFLN